MSQSAAVLDRIASDRDAKNELDAVWKTLASTNSRLAEQADSIEKIQQIANTLQFNTSISERLNKILEQLLKSLAIESNEWQVLTKNWSFQAILNSLVHVDTATVAAINNSHNILQNTRIHSKKTQLFADGNSSNIVDKSSFHGPEGSVSMDGIRTQGPIQVQGSSVGFGENGIIAFGPNSRVGFAGSQPSPPSPIGQCPNCGGTFPVDVKYGMPFKVQCPYCRTMLNVPR